MHLHFPSMIKLNGFLAGNNKENVYKRIKFEIPFKTYKWGVTFNSLISIFSWLITVIKLMFVCLQLQMSLNIFFENHKNIFCRDSDPPWLIDSRATFYLVLREISTGFVWSISQMTPNYIYYVRKYRKPHFSTYTGHCTMGKMRGQIFVHFSKYFTIWEITFLLITQSNLNGFKFRKKRSFCLSFASVIKHSPHF